MYVFVDDADVRRPGDNERHQEVDDSGYQHIGGVLTWIAHKFPRPTTAHVCPQKHRDIERHVVNPYADDNSRSYFDFQPRSTELLQSQKSTKQL